MTDLTPEKRAELRAAVEDRRLFRFVTERGSDGYPSSGFLEIDREVLALLDERDRLAAAVRQIAEACHWSHDPSDDPEALSAYIGQLQRSADDAIDAATAAERIRALHERDGEGFCVVCDYMTPHPCPTLRALDGTDDGTPT